MEGNRFDLVSPVFLLAYWDKINFSSSLFRVSFVKLRANTPCLAREICPVSSETTTTIASDTSLMPKAARCLVPKLTLTLSLFVKGKIQPAAHIMPSLITIAPSCNGALLKKIFPIICAEGCALMTVPESMMSPSLVCIFKYNQRAHFQPLQLHHRVNRCLNASTAPLFGFLRCFLKNCPKTNILFRFLCVPAVPTPAEFQAGTIQ